MSEPRLIYFMRPVGQLGPIKIGCSKTPDLRLDTMARWSPQLLEIICTTSGTMADEAALVERYPDDADRIYEQPDSFISNTGPEASPLPPSQRGPEPLRCGTLGAGGRGGGSPRRFGGGE